MNHSDALPSGDTLSLLDPTANLAGEQARHLNNHHATGGAVDGQPPASVVSRAWKQRRCKTARHRLRPGHLPRHRTTGHMHVVQAKKSANADACPVRQPGIAHVLLNACHNSVCGCVDNRRVRGETSLWITEKAPEQPSESQHHPPAAPAKEE